jgi:acyl-CoA synthetase (AMP-forming)/AMP-acid ligase II
MTPTIQTDKDYINVAQHLAEMARRRPYDRAVVYPVARDNKGRVAYSHLTFRQLDQESDCLARGFMKYGVTRGTRTVLMIRPGLEFLSVVYAMFKVGAVPVVVDPGMGLKRMVNCYRQTRPEVFIGVPLAHVIRTVLPKFFKSVNVWITVGKRWFWGGLTLDQVRETPWKPFTPVKTRADETAAILFTTGSTGPAKGVVYSHENFDAQVDNLKGHFGIKPGEVDLPTFPLYALFDPALGMTAVIPDMDPTKPAHADPGKIVEAIHNNGITNMTASPALLNRVGSYGHETGFKLPTIKRVITTGAPIAPSIIEKFSEMLTGEGQIYPGYGATEAMPVSSIGSNEILADTRKYTEQGYGVCVGRAVDTIEQRIIRISDDPIEAWSHDLEVPEGEIGEITVKGKVVTKKYFEKPNADALAKIKDGQSIWHRMGDLGWLDNKGRIWFCGRKSHRVVTADGTMYTIPCEAIFNNHPQVFRSALVGVGAPPEQTPVICIELEKSGDGKDENTLEQELLELAADNDLTRPIKTLLFHKGFPVDIRHNSKIFREKLAVWAEKKLK